MAITGHKTMVVFTRYDTVDEEDLIGPFSQKNTQKLHKFLQICIGI